MKIALTGGPSAGKTSVLDILSRCETERITTIPEAASILFRGGFPRELEDEQRKCQQRAIYHVQKELENSGSLKGSPRALVCDRGSLDGLAYWPGDETSFFRAVDSTMEKEIARYDWVIHLDTASTLHYESTSVRTETPLLARDINEKVKHAWRLHPRRIIVPNATAFIRKAEVVIGHLSNILNHAI